MIFIAGIHGVGKTHFCKEIELDSGVNYFSASSLIEMKLNNKFNQTKRNSSIAFNQLILETEVTKIKNKYRNFILEGHFCLLDNQGKVEKISYEVFEHLKLEIIYVLNEDPKIIMNRLKIRDNLNWSENFITKFQNEEIAHAKSVAAKLNIKCIVVKPHNLHNIKKIIIDNLSTSILLPIHPQYIEKIFEGSKKFEYRRKLCKYPINKIYLYSTSPIKKIVGEVEVMSKRSEKIEDLWNETKEYSGITEEVYKTYFNGLHQGYAYELGKIIKYEKPKSLCDFGLHFHPQSYIYIS